MSCSVKSMTPSAAYLHRLLRTTKLSFGLSRGRFSQANPTPRTFSLPLPRAAGSFSWTSSIPGGMNEIGDYSCGGSRNTGDTVAQETGWSGPHTLCLVNDCDCRPRPGTKDDQFPLENRTTLSREACSYRT